MKNLILPLFLLTTLSYARFTVNEYPMGPSEDITPGKLCEVPDRYRYPERIGYCERNVSQEQKMEVFENYRKKGFRLNPLNRSSYKIDHYIPLCAGGSNSNENLWPQHMSIYSQTDDLEQLGCEIMSLGNISQAEFIRLLKLAKNDLTQVEEVRDELIKLRPVR